jgi:hypothetical protein
MGTDDQDELRDRPSPPPAADQPSVRTGPPGLDSLIAPILFWLCVFGAGTWLADHFLTGRSGHSAPERSEPTGAPMAVEPSASLPQQRRQRPDIEAGLGDRRGLQRHGAPMA